MTRRHKRRSRSKSRFKRRVLFASASALMLVSITALIIPYTRQQHMPLARALAAVGVMWLAGVIAMWVCVRSLRRRRHSQEPVIPRAAHMDSEEGSGEEG